MAKKHQEARSYPVPMDYFVQKLRAINQAGLNVELKSENPAANGVWFRIHHGVTFTSWGEKITVTLENLGGGTGVHILSECGMPTQVVDWGKNASNVRAVFDYLERGMPYGGQPANVPQQQAYAPQQAAQPVYTAPQPAAAAPQAEPVRAQANRYCTYCGAKVPADASFCGECGQKLAR